MRVADLFELCAGAADLHWNAAQAECAAAERSIAIADGEALVMVPFSPWRSAPLVLLGALELAVLAERSAASLRTRLFHADVAVVIVADGVVIPQWLVAAAEQSAVALWHSSFSVVRLQQALLPLLLRACLPRCQLHAVLLQVAGVGTLLLGEPGAGKSSRALALLGRGHRLVADDVVSLERSAEGLLVGRNPGRLQGYLFVRGLGVVDVAAEFGVMALAFETEVEQLFSLRGDDDPVPVEGDGVSAQASLPGEGFGQSWLGVPLQGLVVRGDSGAADRVEAYTRRRLLEKRGYRVADAFCTRQRDA